MMKLYDLSNSPYAARVRIQIRFKDLPVEIVDPPFTLRSHEFLDAFPLGKVPLLALDDGSTVAESTVIMDYLEALFPEPALIPANAIARAHNGMLIRYTDNHLAHGLSPLFIELMSPSDDNSGIAAKLDKLQGEVNKLEKLLTALPDFHQRSLQTGDICMATNIYYVLELAGWFGKQSLIDHLPTVSNWWQWVNQHQVVADTIAEMDRAHQAFVKRVPLIKRQGEG